MVIRELKQKSIAHANGIFASALKFLEQCESPNQKGTFNFYPAHTRPLWIKNLPDDADDTSIIALELLRHGRIDRSFVLKNTCMVLKKFRLRNINTPAPEWIRPGVFLTWLSGHEHRNIVDCCVNANVVALFAYAGITNWNGYREACEMIDHGIHWAGDSLQRARFLTPFYPHPIELFYALCHAINQGASELVPSLQKLSQVSWAIEDKKTTEDRPICSSAYGGVVWSSSILQKIRC